MATVSEIAIEYSAKGAQAVQRADKGVRDSVTETAQTARSESGAINRWMERHKSAIQTIGVAAAGAMGAILAASPTMRAELSGVRTAFSLFADTIVRDVLPAGEGLVSTAFEILDAYQRLPDPIRSVTSSLILFGSAAAAAAVLISPVAGALILAVGAFHALSNAVSPSVGLLAATVVLAGALLVIVGPIAAGIMLAVGAFLALQEAVGLANAVIITAAILLGALAVVVGVATAPVLALIAAVAALALAWKNNWFDIRGITMAVINTLKSAWNSFTDFLSSLLSGAIDAIKGMWSGFKSWFTKAFDALGDAVAGAFKDAFNAAIPSSINLPSTTIAGREIGGGSFDLPQLRTGGMIERGGLARVHAGEQVLPAAQVSDLGSGAGAGGRSVSIGEINVTIESSGSSREDGRQVGREASRHIQDEFRGRR